MGQTGGQLCTEGARIEEADKRVGLQPDTSPRVSLHELDPVLRGPVLHERRCIV